MTNFTYTTNIPDAPNNPSNDQGPMKVNTNSVDGIIGIEHFSFNDNLGGLHKKVTYATLNVPPAQSDPSSAAYTNVGIADSAHPQHYWKNSQGIFPLSAIRAFANFSTILLPGPPTVNNSFNVSSITGGTAVNGSGIYVVNLTTGSTSGTAVTVFLQSSNISSTIGYTFAANTLTINVTGALPGAFINVLILQI